MQTLSLKTCQLLYNLLGDEIETEYYWVEDVFRCGGYTGNYLLSGRTDEKKLQWYREERKGHFYPAYTLQTLLSRELLEALGKRLGWDKNVCGACGSAMEEDKLFCNECFCDYTEPYQNQVPEWKYQGEFMLNLSWESMDEMEEYVNNLINDHGL